MKKVTKILGISLSVLFAGGLARSFANDFVIESHAGDSKDLGSAYAAISDGNGASGFYVNIADITEGPYSGAWDLNYEEADENPCFKLNGQAVHCFMKRLTVKQYYVCLSDKGISPNIGDVVTISGRFKATKEGMTYYLTVLESSFERLNETSWGESCDPTKIEDYDIFSLNDLDGGDYSYKAINTEGFPNQSNTFPISSSNAHHNFAFRFYYANDGTDDNGALTIRVGSYGEWVTGDYFMANICNTWGPKGVIALYKCNGDNAAHIGGDINCDLKSSTPQLFEIGCSRIADSNKMYVWTKINGTKVGSVVYDAFLTILSTKVGMYYNGTNVSLTDASNTISEKVSAHETINKYRMANGNGTSSGIYIYVPEENGSLYNEDWSVRLYSTSINNVKLNGEGVIPAGKKVLCKYAKNDYYLAFGDFGVTAKAGDTITMGGIFSQFNPDTGLKMLFDFPERQFVFDGSWWQYVKVLVDYVDDAIEEVNSYRIGELEEADVEQLSEAKATCLSQLSEVTAQNEIAPIVNSYETAVDNYLAKKLADAKSSAIQELESYKSSSDYREVEQLELSEAIEDGTIAINNASSLSEVASELASAKSAIDEIKTNAQYEQEEANARAAAIAELESYKSSSDYREAEQTLLAEVIEAGKTAINQAGTVSEINAALANAKAAIDEIKTAAEYEAEEAAAALQEAKDNAKSELENYKSSSDYREAEQALLAEAIEAGKSAIDACEDQEAVAQALINAKAAIDEIKTAAEYEAEEAANKGCGGSIIAVSGLVTILSIFGMAIVSKKRR